MDFKYLLLVVVATVGFVEGAPDTARFHLYCGPTLLGGPSTNPACLTTTTQKPTQLPGSSVQLPVCPTSCCRIQCPNKDDGCAKKKSPVCFPADATKEPAQGAYCHDVEAGPECTPAKCQLQGSQCSNTVCDKNVGRICPYVKLTPPLPACPASCCKIECANDDVICKAAKPACEYTDGVTPAEEGKVCLDVAEAGCDKTKCKPSADCAAAADCVNKEALCPFIK